MARKPKTELTHDEEFCQLSWLILELKFAYYHPAEVHASWKDVVSVPDAVYDRAEDRYRALGKSLGKACSAQSMVGFDRERPCCRVVLSKLTEPRGERISMMETVGLNFL